MKVLWENIRLTLCMFIKNIKVMKRYGLDSLVSILNPLISLLPFILLSLTMGDKTDQFFINSGVQSSNSYFVISYFTSFFISNTIVMASMFIAYEIKQGTFETLMLSPRKERVLVGNHLVSGYLLYVLESVILGTIFLMFVNSLTLRIDFSLVLLTITIAYFASYGLGLLLAGLTIKTKMPRTTFMINAIILLTSGSSYSIMIMPLWLRAISFVNPLTYAIDIMRYAILKCPTYFSLDVEILLFLVVSLFWFTVGKYIFATMLRNMKTLGSLTSY